MTATNLCSNFGSKWSIFVYFFKFYFIFICVLFVSVRCLFPYISFALFYFFKIKKNVHIILESKLFLKDMTRASFFPL